MERQLVKEGERKMTKMPMEYVIRTIKLADDMEWIHISKQAIFLDDVCDAWLSENYDVQDHRTGIMARRVNGEYEVRISGRVGKWRCVGDASELARVSSVEIDQAF